MSVPETTVNDLSEQSELPCTRRFVVQPGQVYKTTLGEMGIDLSKTKLQFTNNGTVAITVSAGFETDSVPT